MDFLKNLPRGKDDKPILLMQGEEFVIKSDEVDGPLAMLDRDFSGCIALSFSKRIDESVPGVITLDGIPVRYFHRFVNFGGGLPLIGASVVPYTDEYNKTYTLHIEGFTDTDGNAMLPRDIVVRTLPRTLPDPQFALREKVALQAAEEGIVLMKNKGDALPLKPGILHIFGHGLHTFRDCGAGAGRINSRYAVNLKRAIRESDIFTLNEELAQHFKAGDGMPDERLLQAAAATSDTAIVILSRFGGENTDASTAKGEFYLTDAEDELIQKLTKRFAKTVVILNTPGPIDVRFSDDYNVDALLWCGFGGMLCGAALLDILSGKANPSGKLTDTWAKDYYDIPASRNFYNCAKDGSRHEADAGVWLNTVYEEGLYVGYRYFDTFGVRPAYAFGHGLSYTSFEISGTKSSFNGECATVCLSVKNTGQYPGKEVVQVYASKPESLLEQCARELVAFEKTKLLVPGESQDFVLEIPVSRFRSYDEKTASYVLCAGEYSLYLGNALDTASPVGRFMVEQLRVLKQVKNRVCPPMAIKTLSKKDPKGSWPEGKLSGVREGANCISPAREAVPYTPKPIAEQQENLTFAEVLQNPALAYSYAAGFSTQQLCRLTVCAKDNWNMAGFGVGGRLAIPEGLDMTPFAVADGNSCVKVDPASTGFPASGVYCASFNKELVYAIGQILGEEAVEREVGLITGPGLNLHRNPLNGRNIEYFSEDPYLTGVMAGTLAAGIEDMGVGANYKHFIANNAETSRKRNHSIMTERTLRELYLQAFVYAMEVCNPVSVMTAYNACNGRFAAADAELIEGMLREENGFTGYVMTDWNSYDSCDMIEMLLAGNNWLTPGSLDDKFTKLLEAAVSEGRLPLSVLQESVGRMLYVVATLHLRRKERERMI